MQKSVKEDREKYIGGSDIPVIMGISPFKTRYELLLEKAGLKEDTFEGNEYTEYGNTMEPKIRDFINQKYEYNFVETKTIVDDCRYHADGDDEEKETMLEIKTTSKTYSNVRECKLYLVQLLKGMMLKKYKKGKLAVYFRVDNWDESMHVKEHCFDYEFNEEYLAIYDIDIKDYEDWCNEINQAVEQFRIDLQKLKENPFLTEEDLLPVDLTKISYEIIALENKLKEYKKMEQEQKELKEQLKKAMEEKGIKSWQTPNGAKIILVEDGKDKEVMKFNENKFKEENEDIYNKYLETKIQKGRNGYVLITLPKED